MADRDLLSKRHGSFGRPWCVGLRPIDDYLIPERAIVRADGKALPVSVLRTGTCIRPILTESIDLYPIGRGRQLYIRWNTFNPNR